MGWLILQTLMFLLCSPPIVFLVLTANIRWEFTNTMTATVLRVFTNYVLGMPKER